MKDIYANDEQWKKSSDEWVKTMDESRRRKNEAQLSHERKFSVMITNVITTITDGASTV